MKEYKIKYLNEIPAFNTVENEVKGLPGLGNGSQNYVMAHNLWGSIFWPRKVQLCSASKILESVTLILFEEIQ